MKKSIADLRMKYEKQQTQNRNDGHERVYVTKSIEDLGEALNNVIGFVICSEHDMDLVRNDDDSYSGE